MVAKKKSQASFEHLIKIGHPDFCPEDVAGNNWWLIDARLSGECSEGLNKEDDWEDEQASWPKLEGWIKTPIKIKVPFHKKMKYPGQKEFNAGILHHRKLMSMIRERITWPSMYPHLHLYPYKLFWQPNAAADSGGKVWSWTSVWTRTALNWTARLVLSSVLEGEPNFKFSFQFRQMLIIVNATEPVQMGKILNTRDCLHKSIEAEKNHDFEIS